MFRWLLESSLANRLLVLVLGTVLMGYGAFTLTRTPVDVFPDLEPPHRSPSSPRLAAWPPRRWSS